MAESFAPTITKSESDTFLTTPDEDDDKIINTNTGLEGDALEHRQPKKDLLEIDRFTICGNRIDWAPQTNNQSRLWQSCRVQGSDTGHGACSEQAYFCAPDLWSIYLFISDKTSQSVKLLQSASETASDVPLWSSQRPVNQVDCRLTTVTGANLRAQLMQRKRKILHLLRFATLNAMWQRNMTAGL